MVRAFLKLQNNRGDGDNGSLSRGDTQKGGRVTSRNEKEEEEEEADGKEGRGVCE